MNCIEKAQGIVEDSVSKYFVGERPQLKVEPLMLPSCGLMGDNKVYGYAWSISGIKDHDAPEARFLLKELGVRLTNEVLHDDGTRFVRVFAEITY